MDLARYKDKIGIAQQQVGIEAMLRRVGDADAGADQDLQPFDGDRAADVADQPFGQSSDILHIVATPDQDREFIATQPRHHVGLSSCARMRSAAACSTRSPI